MTTYTQFFISECLNEKDESIDLIVSIDEKENKIFLLKDIYTNKEKEISIEEVKKLKPVFNSEQKKIELALKSEVIWVVNFLINKIPLESKTRIFKRFSDAEKYKQYLLNTPNTESVKVELKIQLLI